MNCTLISGLKPDAQIHIPLMDVMYIGLLPSGIGSPFVKQIIRHFGDTILLEYKLAIINFFIQLFLIKIVI